MQTTWLLQPWTTIAGSGSDAVTQSAAWWLDLSDFTDVELLLSVRDFRGTVRMSYETAPSHDEELFGAMTSFIVSVTARDVQVVPFASAAEPCARFVRWKLLDVGAASWSVTFRIWVRGAATNRAAESAGFEMTPEQRGDGRGEWQRVRKYRAPPRMMLARIREDASRWFPRHNLPKDCECPASDELYESSGLT